MEAVSLPAESRRFSYASVRVPPTEQRRRDALGQCQGRRLRSVPADLLDQGAEKRKEHGSKGSRVFRDPEDASRVWVVFDWEVEDYEKFIADPEVPAIFQEAGLQGPPVKAEAAGQYDS